MAVTCQQLKLGTTRCCEGLQVIGLPYSFSWIEILQRCELALSLGEQDATLLRSTQEMYFPNGTA